MNQRIGILGGGQLGKMLYSAGSQLDMDLHFLDGQPDCPVAKVAPSVQVGGLKDPKAILAFGADKDILTIEIEKVNTAVLEELRQSGKKVFPQPHVIELIQDKGRQKEFYASDDIPSSDFALYHSKEAARSEVSSGRWTYPFVQKMRTDGYDGRGVHMIRSEADWDDAFPNNFLIEAAVDIKKELAVVTCTDTQGHTICYDPVEMVFHPEANLLLYQLAPADVSASIRTSAQKLAKDVAQKYGVVGLLAVELFVDQEDQLLVNEVAPRPHNSGHHTIEACYTSQYENHLRAISGLPLGDHGLISPSLLLNILGNPECSGPVHYEGMEKVLAIAGANVHLYGKTMTKPYRKMGHINLLDPDTSVLVERYQQILQTLKVITK